MHEIIILYDKNSVQGLMSECGKKKSKQKDLKYIYGCYVKFWKDKCDW